MLSVVAVNTGAYAFFNKRQVRRVYKHVTPHHVLHSQPHIRTLRECCCETVSCFMCSSGSGDRPFHIHSCELIGLNLFFKKLKVNTTCILGHMLVCHVNSDLGDGIFTMSLNIMMDSV